MIMKKIFDYVDQNFDLHDGGNEWNFVPTAA